MQVLNSCYLFSIQGCTFSNRVIIKNNRLYNCFNNNSCFFILYQLWICDILPRKFIYIFSHFNIFNKKMELYIKMLFSSSKNIHSNKSKQLKNVQL